MNQSSFIDGPAAGVSLSLDRPPIMLRVVKGPEGWDALNLGSDTPREDEEVHTYITSAFSSGFWDGRDPKTGRRTGGQFFRVKYRHLAGRPHPQPGDSTLRDNAAWRAWCDTHKDSLTDLHKKLREVEL